MIKITIREGMGCAATMCVEGHLVGPYVDELRRAYEARLGEGQGSSGVALDLFDVTFLDERGARLLAELAARGAVIRRSSPFVQARLRSGVASDPPR